MWRITAFVRLHKENFKNWISQRENSIFGEIESLPIKAGFIKLNPDFSSNFKYLKKKNSSFCWFPENVMTIACSKFKLHHFAAHNKVVSLAGLHHSWDQMQLCKPSPFCAHVGQKFSPKMWNVTKYSDPTQQIVPLMKAEKIAVLTTHGHHFDSFRNQYEIWWTQHLRIAQKKSFTKVNSPWSLHTTSLGGC